MTKIPGLSVAPVGLAFQDTIDESGNIIPKQRLTHDQTFELVAGHTASFNHRLRLDELTPLTYGHALLRYVHHIVNLRRQHPNRRILQTKVDWKAAYRRLHNCASVAVQSCVWLGGFILVALRLTFGGAQNPSRWSDLSELACNLANDLVSHPDWDPKHHASPHQPTIDGIIEPYPLPETPFAPALPVHVPLPDSDEPKADVFIDDKFMAFIDRDLARGGAILPFVILTANPQSHCLAQ